MNNVPLVIVGVQFLQDFIVLRPSTPHSLLFLLGQPWLYATKVQVNWKKQEMTFGHPKVTISCADVQYQGKMFTKEDSYTSDFSMVEDTVHFLNVYVLEDEESALHLEDNCKPDQEAGNG